MTALPQYVELRCLSNFSFLRGASWPEELVTRAKALGYGGLALTDECSLAGVVRAAARFGAPTPGPEDDPEPAGLQIPRPPHWPPVLTAPGCRWMCWSTTPVCWPRARLCVRRRRCNGR